MKVDLTKDKILKGIFLFALPIYIGQLFSMFYGIIDTRIVGSVLGEASLASINSTSSLSELLIEFENGISCGFGIILAQQVGAGKLDKLKKTIANAALLIILLSVMISVLCMAFINPILRFMNVDSDIFANAKKYILIILVGVIFLSVYNFLVAVLRSMGDTITPLIFLIITNVLNIILDISFVKYLNMGVKGAALATAITQVVCCLGCLIYLFCSRKELHFNRSDFALEKNLVGALLKNGMSMGFMLSFVLLGSLALQTGINKLGSDIIVAHTAARRITIVCLIPFFAIGAAMSTFCGQNKGAKEYERINKGVKYSIAISAVWWIVSTACVLLFSRRFVTAITASTSASVVDNAVQYLKINSVLFILPAVICILRNSLQGLGDTKTPLISSLIELVGKICITFTLVESLGYFGVIITEPIVWAIMVIPLIVVYASKTN